MAEKKTSELDLATKKSLIDRELKELTISRQCDLLELSRSTLYYQPCQDNLRNMALMRAIDEIYTENPVYGTRRIQFELRRLGYEMGRALIATLMKKMSIEAIYAKPNLSKANPGHKVYPYLLKGVKIQRVNQVWSTDITYIRMLNGYLYLTAVIDWYSRCVLSWKISNSLEGTFCREVVLDAFQMGKPEIFNTDQGSQYTSEEFLEILLSRQIKPSMDGRGRALDNVFVERLWRSVKYEHIFLKEYRNGIELHQGLNQFFKHYNERRPHMSLGYKFPLEVYKAGM